MARRCGCSGTCSCLIVAGEGVVVEGIGSVENPYEISSDAADLVTRIEFADTSTVDFTTTGVGSGANPMTVSAYARVATSELTDVQGSPADNNVLVWSGDHWEPQPMPSATLPSGGTTGQVLAKIDNADGNYDWADVPHELPVGGSTGQVLAKLSATNYAVNWVDQTGGSGGGTPMETTEYCLLRKSTAQTLASSTEVPITFDAGVSEDPHGMWNGSDLITIAKAGVYLIQAQYSYAAQTTPNGNRITILKINGGTTRQWYHAVTNNILTGTVSIQRDLKAGDVIQLRQYQSTGGNLDTGTPTATAPGLAVVRIGGGGIASERVYSAARSHLAATSITSATSTPVPFDSLIYEDGIAWNGVDGFIAPVAGYYQVDAVITFAPIASGTGVRGCFLTVNGSAFQSANITPNAGSQVTSVVNTAVIKAAAGDVIRVNAYQTQGSALALSGNTAYNKVTIVKIPETIPASNGIIGERIYAAGRQSASGQSIPNSAVTRVNFELAVTSDGITWDATNQGYIIPVTGWYDISLGLSFAANATGYRTCYIQVNNTSIAASGESSATTALGQSVNASKQAYLYAGDLVTFAANHTAGAALALTNNALYNWATIVKVPGVFPQSVALGERTYHAYRAHVTATSIPNLTSTLIPFDTAVTDDGITWDGTGFVCPVAGHYSVEGVLTYASSNTTGGRYVLIYVNGVQYNSTAVAPVASGVVSVPFAATVKCAAGDVIKIQAYQSSGGAVTISASSVYNRVSVTKVPAPVVAGSAASGVWGTAPLDTDQYGTDSLAGREVYVDSRGQLRTTPSVINGGIAVHPVTALPTAYPMGTTTMYVGTADGGPWPSAGACIVVTSKTTNNACTQWCTLNSTTQIKTWVRYGNSNAWTPWVQVTGDGLTKKMAAGRVSVTVTSATTGTASITFPAGLFATTPRVVATAVGSSVWVAYQPSGASPSGAQIGIRQIDGTAASVTLGVDWIAIEE